jgi:hypothetical protein
MNEIFASGKAAPNFELGVLRRARQNAAIFRGLANNPRDHLAQDLLDLTRSGANTTLINANDSFVTDPEEAFDARSRANEIIDLEGYEGNRAGLIEVTGEGSNHTLVDRLGRVRKLVGLTLKPRQVAV